MTIEFGRYYVEIEIHTRITDYLNITIFDFPILIFKRFEFGIHEETKTSTYCFGILGITFYYTVDN